MNKQCSSCKKVKSTKEFHRNKAQRDGFQNQCKACKGKANKAYLGNSPDKRKETIANYYARNREAILENLKKYWEENPEKRQEIRRRSCKKTYDEDPEKFRQKARKWRGENPERFREIIAKAYRKAYDAQPEKFREQVREWKKNNPDKVREMSRHRAALKRAQGYGASGHVSRNINQILMSSQKGRCYYCNRDLLELGFHQDHKVPLAREGLHDDSNLVLACPPCNLKKSTKTAEEFIGG